MCHLLHYLPVQSLRSVRHLLARQHLPHQWLLEWSPPVWYPPYHHHLYRPEFVHQQQNLLCFLVWLDYCLELS
ncbi:hypothetical protein DR94_3663 [Proteus mirabilis]|nr:hypothetical protein DR94_3663 [Proteus mirabilis]